MAAVKGALIDRSAEFAQLVSSSRPRSGPGAASVPAGLSARTLELSRHQQTVNAVRARLSPCLGANTARPRHLDDAPSLPRAFALTCRLARCRDRPRPVGHLS